MKCPLSMVLGLRFDREKNESFSKAIASIMNPQKLLFLGIAQRKDKICSLTS